MKSAKDSVKSRTIEPEVISKFREKLVELEPKIKKIIIMENEEAALRAAENQVNRAENKLQGNNKKRDWFQVNSLLYGLVWSTFIFRQDTKKNWKRHRVCWTDIPEFRIKIREIKKLFREQIRPKKEQKEKFSKRNHSEKEKKKEVKKETGLEPVIPHLIYVILHIWKSPHFISIRKPFDISLSKNL